jgi:hypothetical protein
LQKNKIEMWNYRVVRKRHIYVDPDGNKEKVSYTYAIHEAHYDKNGHVGAITQDPIEPFGDNIEELRHAWVMMAEAFGLPILDYDDLPEPGYDRREDPIASTLDERLKEMEAGEVEGIPWEDVKRDLEKKYGPLDEEAHEKQAEEERIEKEKIHAKIFVGLPTLQTLIDRVCSDYLEYMKRDGDENPWKYGADRAGPVAAANRRGKTPASD